jgi:beta-galactosidase
VGANLDIASWDTYPLDFLPERLPATPEYRKRFVRQGDPDFQAFHHGLCRAVGRGRWWIMEQQPGPANWAPSNPDPLPGMARLWAMEAFAQEHMHAGLVRPDSIAAPAYDEAAIMAGDLAQMPEVSTAHADVGLVFDYASAWAWET